MNYQEALEYISSVYKFGSKLGLENIKYLLNLMGNPHEGLKVIHVAGTNGKGSTSSFISSVLVEQGYKVGLYTSPFLEEFTERIRVNGMNIPKGELAEITAFTKEKVEEMLASGMNHPTEFEVVTAIGFEYFKRQMVDYLVLEVGLGGRGDSTNVIDDPLVSVITPIDFDHIEYLGNTLDKIAYEKAGIIKKNSFVVSYPQKEEAMKVIQEVSAQQHSNLRVAAIDRIELLKYDEEGQCFNTYCGEEKFENLSISLLGEHQTQNATVALTALNVLMDEHHIPISREALYEGFKKAVWPGRLEIMKKNPTVLIDGAHNIHGIIALKKALTKLYAHKKILLVIAILGDKDVSGMLSEMIPLADQVVLTQPNNERALPVDKLAEKVMLYNKPIRKEAEIPQAVEAAFELAGEEDVIVFCGSLYMIGDVRTILRTRK
ncbi:bifunctional folylpolyglutamate synthase/dihydrofolate synthase [Geosporobacter ferrireducens]|uniref:tetrahydrofolate synthase n=2 Tax=Geosporobacter ferrireducens TaxID=1424294 RepID=A0A1D8GD59_9FIRM|nr:folylpolyglutamate synthase/dihydrofolate synthase family protein [Geosporobacter ferrireducens]AOT68848.1 bifunctional folylpolyglutamate synthase/dihydrofolate synthase [Geosporobacter ferrireducens]MTI54919.1 bifunctional folylpolyglutamate synthase/dihydrofolate synthase [Geosporobacter ferrireducens]